MKKWLKITLISIVVLFLLLVVYIYSNIYDRNAGYSLNLSLPNTFSPAAINRIKVGLDKQVITPPIIDTWIDKDHNAKYEPNNGDEFIDKNGNGKFDAYWIAGFGNKRAAMGVHDDIWARTVLWDDGNSQVALVVLDAIGFFHDDVITVRKMVAKEYPEIDHVIVSSIHNHEVPDLLGQWGPGMFTSGVNPRYKKYVQQQAVKAIGNAYKNRRSAVIKYAKLDSIDRDLVGDTRPPYVWDDNIRIMQFCDPKTDKPFGLFLNWGNHPETVGSDNLLITADFAHYWLEGLEKGIYYNNELKRPGFGGTVVYANGAIGGLMTSLRDSIYDPWLDKKFKKSGFDKARTQGYRLADLVLNQLENKEWETESNPKIKLKAKTFIFSLENKLFMLASALGVLKRGLADFGLRSEVDFMTIGDISLLTVPGEIYPEIVNGGIEQPDGADYPETIVESPPLRALMPGRIKFVIGLANDEVGYILPLSQWDAEKPYTYGAKKRWYGEVNSVGHEAGPVYYKEAVQLIKQMNSQSD